MNVSGRAAFVFVSSEMPAISTHLNLEGQLLRDSAVPNNCPYKTSTASDLVDDREAELLETMPTVTLADFPS